MAVLKRLIVFLCLAALTLSSAVFAAEYEIKDFKIKTITVPDEYMSCSTDKCDEELSRLLSGNKYTFDQWAEGVLVPNNFEIYACNKKILSDCLYLICKELPSPKTDDGAIEHRLAADYNLIKDGEEMSEFLEDKKIKNNMDTASWITDTATTPYIEYTKLIGKDYCHCYETIYNGNLITLQFSSKNEFTKAQKDAHKAVLDSIEYSEKADYTEINSLINEALQKKLEEETHSGENTKILRIIISVSVVFVIGFAILLAIRSQNKKRRRSAFIRESDENTND